MEIFPPQKIKIVDIEGKGRGVIATQDIKNGETIEICPILYISKEEADFIKNKAEVLKYYCLEQVDNDKLCVMFGYGSIYNHDSENPNADIDYREGKSDNYLYFKAIKDIKAGEEIVYDYEFDDGKVEFLKSK